MAPWLKPKLKHHGHSGRLRPHEFTSYTPLAFLLLIVGVSLLGCSVSALNDPPPQASSVSLTGIMREPPPSVAATITAPTKGQHFGTSPITVEGTCPKQTLVEVYKNDIFAGSTLCGDTGTYSLQVDLLLGQNILIARVYDVLNQPGPDSNAVTVFYDALPPQTAGISSLNFSGTQLVLNTNAVYRGVFPDRELSVPLNVLGGVPPYAINVQWGDGKNSVIPRNDNLSFNATHTYHKAGTFQISIQATDSQGRVAFITVAAIVNGQPPITPVSNTTKATMNKLLVLWPLYASLVAIVISFWLGERREKHILGVGGLTLHPQS